MHSKNVPTALSRPTIGLLLGGAAIGMACLLRMSQSHPVLARISRDLDHDMRAVIEHFLAGIGVPLTIGLLYIAVTRVCAQLLYRAAIPQAWPWSPLKKLQRKGVTFRDSALIVGWMAAAYAVVAFQWEWNQAYVDVYGAGPRGYIQWGQFAADLCGGTFALLLARRIAANSCF
jgi:hypothetical protein